MRYGRHLRHRRYSRHERHGTKLREFMNGPLTTRVPDVEDIQAGADLTLWSFPEGGVEPYTHVWKKGGVVVAGQTGVNLFIPSVTEDAAGSYTVTTTDAVSDSVTSNACALTVSPAP